MILPVQIIADWECIRHRKQNMIHTNCIKENNKRKPYDFQPGHELMLSEGGAKLTPRFLGPFIITKTHTNGTVTIKRTPHHYQRVNIRRIKPYHRRVQIPVRN